MVYDDSLRVQYLTSTSLAHHFIGKNAVLILMKLPDEPVQTGKLVVAQLVIVLVQVLLGANKLLPLS